MKRHLLFLAAVLLIHNAKADRPLIIAYNDVVKAAKAELDSSMINGALKEFAIEHKVKGEYIMDITLHEKGKVLTVFAVSNDTDDLKMQTKLKDFIRTIQFSFKLPKGKPYKFQYTFQFN